MPEESLHASSPTWLRRLAVFVLGWLRRSLVPICVLAAAAGAVFGLTLLKGDQEQAPKVQSPVVNVSVVQLKPIERLEDTPTLKASVEPWATVRISAETAGCVDRITVHEGDLVGRGAPLVYLEDDLLAAAYAEAKAKADFDTRELQRKQTAQGRNVATDMEVDIARSAAAGSKASVDHAAAQLRRAVIKAPETIHDAPNGTDHVGRLNRLAVEIGEYVQPGQLVAEIVDTSVVKVVVDVPEMDIRYLRVGQEVNVSIRALGDREVTGTIHFIAMVADPFTRTYRVEARVPNPDDDIRPGMVVKVKLLRRVLNDVIMIPLKAVIPLEKNYEVFISEGGVARRRVVSLAGSLILGDQVQALPPAEGLALQPGDRLIVEGQHALGDGQRVREQLTPAQMLTAAEAAPAQARDGQE